MFSSNDVHIALQSALPTEDQAVVAALAELLADIANGNISQQDASARFADPLFSSLLRASAGSKVSVSGSLISFGEGNQFGDITIGNVAAGNIIELTFTTQQTIPMAPALHQLRPPVADFIGREYEINQLVEGIRSTAISGAVAAISSVRGLGGVGKTQLAYKVADALKGVFPDAQLVIELRGASLNPLTPEQALQTIIHAFEPDARLPEDLTQLQSRYLSHLTNKRVLLLADDALNDVQITPLLPPPGCALIITSRHRFALSGMSEIDLTGLSHEEAVTLLLRICPRIGPAATVLAARCGYLPLALRVSASLLQSDDTLSIVDYLQRLDNERERVRQIRDPENPLHDVEAVLNSSYVLLPPVAQQALCQASVFPAMFDRLAARAVIVAPDDTLNILSILRRRSLIEWNADADCYDMHDLVRAFGFARLSDETDVIQRYTAHYLQIAQEASHQLTGAKQNRWLNRLEQLFPHLQASLDRSSAALRLQFATALWRYWEGRGHFRTGRIWLEKALEPTSIPELEVATFSTLRAEAFTGIGALARAQGDYAAAKAACSSSLTLWRTTGDQGKIARALNNLGQVNLYLADDQEAEEAFRESLMLAEHEGDVYLTAVLRCNIGVLAGDRGDTEQAVVLLTDGIAALRPLADDAATAMYLDNLASLFRQMGQLVEARSCLTESLEIRQRIDDRWGSVGTYENLGLLHLAEGQTNKAAVCFQTSLDLAQEIEDIEGVIWAIEGIAMVASIWKRFVQAARLYSAAAKARKKNDIELPFSERIRYEQFLTTLAAQLNTDYQRYLDLDIATSLSDASIEAHNLIREHLT